MYCSASAKLGVLQNRLRDITVPCRTKSRSEAESCADAVTSFRPKMILAELLEYLGTLAGPQLASSELAGEHCMEN